MTQDDKRLDVAWPPLASERVQLADALTALLFRYDPIHIGYQTNSDEYEPEALHILGRLGKCHDALDVCRVIYEELVRSFGSEAVGSTSDYEQIAGDAWQLWLGSRVG